MTTGTYTAGQSVSFIDSKGVERLGVIADRGEWNSKTRGRCTSVWVPRIFRGGATGRERVTVPLADIVEA